MNLTEAKKLIAILMVTYQNYNPIDTDFAAEMWVDALDGYSWQQVNNGLKIYIRTNTSGFAPSPGQLIEKIQMVTEPQDMSEMEAWSLVSKAIRNSAYNSAAEYERLPDAVQRAVGSSSQLFVWACDDNYNEQVVSSNFMRSYRQAVAEKKEFNKLPVNIRNMIERTSQQMISTNKEK